MNIAGLFIEAARPGDADTCAAILSDWTDETDWMPQIHSRAETRGILADLIGRGWVTVARRCGRAVGFIARDGQEIHALYIAPAMRGQGLGRALLATARLAEDQLGLWCFQANQPALRFYAREGFREVARSAGEGNDAQLPDIRLEWSKP